MQKLSPKLNPKKIEIENSIHKLFKELEERLNEKI